AFSFLFSIAARTTLYSPLPLHDALPIFDRERELSEARDIIEASQSFLLVGDRRSGKTSFCKKLIHELMARPGNSVLAGYLNLQRSEEHTSELQSRRDLVCRLLLEKKKKQ